MFPGERPWPGGGHAVRLWLSREWDPAALAPRFVPSWAAELSSDCLSSRWSSRALQAREGGEGAGDSGARARTSSVGLRADAFLCPVSHLRVGPARDSLIQFPRVNFSAGRYVSGLQRECVQSGQTPGRNAGSRGLSSVCADCPRSQNQGPARGRGCAASDGECGSLSARWTRLGSELLPLLGCSPHRRVQGSLPFLR